MKQNKARKDHGVKYININTKGTQTEHYVHGKSQSSLSSQNHRAKRTEQKQQEKNIKNQQK